MLSIRTIGRYRMSEAFLLWCGGWSWRRRRFAHRLGRRLQPGVGHVAHQLARDPAGVVTDLRFLQRLRDIDQRTPDGDPAFGIQRFGDDADARAVLRLMRLTRLH